MSIINSQPLIGASGNQSTAYNLTRSLRFRSSASAYLNRTIGTPTSGSTWTISFWMKRGAISSSNYMYLFSYDNTASNGIAIASTAATTDAIYAYNATAGTTYGTTARLLRDPSSWYHIVFSCNAGTGTLYVNNQQQLTISSMPSMTNGMGMNIGRLGNGNQYFFDGYLTETNFIDGQALTPSDFGETDTATGVWKPKKYTGTYGTNGFYLKFDNLTSTSTLGNDSSGNSNTWTVNNISLTSGSTYDSMKDVPTLTDADTANYCVLNPLSRTAGTVSEGNLKFVGAGTTGGNRINGTTAVSSGKWYYEVTILNAPYSPRATNTWYNAFGFGLATAFNATTSPNTTTDTLNYQDSGFVKNGSNANSDTGSAVANGDVLAVAVDLDANTYTFYKNNSSVSSGTIDITAGTLLVPMIISYDGSYGTMVSNFGQRPFAYTPPSGFKALNTFNLPTPTIGATASTQANDYFNVVTWTGDGNNPRTVSGVGFQPDFVWAKLRSGAASNTLYDAVRGTGKVLFSDLTNDEATNNAFGYLSAFNSDGFVASAGSTNNAYFNTSSSTYVAWNWKANGAGSSNTAGTITSTVSANTTAGFSIVTYTGNSSSAATVGHGLGVKPDFIVIKSRDESIAWMAWHSALSTQLGYLNLTDAFDGSRYSWALSSTQPTSTLITLGDQTSNGYATNRNNYKFVAYCFAEVAGYSKFGSYTGNGSTDGTFVFTGFRPKFVMTKASSSVTNGHWIIKDTARDSRNLTVASLYPNLSNAEDTVDTAAIDILSNGFKIRGAFNGINNSGSSYIYIAFAENPFKYSLAR